MKSIPFPSQYKRSVQDGIKKWTLRMGNELGKYEKGEVYNATSYPGNNWGINIRVIDVISTKVGKLSEHKVPTKSIDSLLNREDIKESTIVDLVKFDYMFHRDYNNLND